MNSYLIRRSPPGLVTSLRRRQQVGRHQQENCPAEKNLGGRSLAGNPALGSPSPCAQLSGRVVLTRNGDDTLRMAAVGLDILLEGSVSEASDRGACPS
eukprot:8314849-Pyramimonas_sp.AAC.1